MSPHTLRRPGHVTIQGRQVVIHGLDRAGNRVDTYWSALGLLDLMNELQGVEWRAMQGLCRDDREARDDQYGQEAVS